MLRLWGKYFSTLLKSDDDTNTAFRDDVPELIVTAWRFCRLAMKVGRTHCGLSCSEKGRPYDTR